MTGDQGMKITLRRGVAIAVYGLLAVAGQVFAADSSGEDLPIGDFGPWKQVFTEDFLLDAALGEFVAKYDDKWKARGANWDFDQRNPGQVPVADTSRRGIYSPANTLSVSSGVLDIAPHKGDGPQFGPDGRLEQNEWPELVDLPWEQERPYVAALTPRVLGPDGEMTYGRFTVRLKVEYPEDNPAGGEGYKIANLLWPKSDLWPDDGEIDYPEGDFSDNSFSAFHHYTCDATKPSPDESSECDKFRSQELPWQDGFYNIANFSSWHTATIEWMPDRINFLLDGELAETRETNPTDATTTTRVPNKPMYHVMQIETELNNDYIPVESRPHIKVAWMSIWKYEP
ncbi:hypothetical protein W97_08956 [Coniosporium apollinis CBS 100218]|uniref:GH16 domain-containing protein n=1 Tax=Coniosporium apollinis (strain CBS 100218) TaxID=1168221 RepID=R7Z704_CONA1|nr:uncharacterized protein W97_08956 [Coniosporium apollinis CBS 100218]EON69696.1 hypothetical protein W97_08956 [Coniosporium apollinis CBS 100218]